MTTRPTLEPRPAGEYAHIEQLPDPPRPYDAMYQLPYVSSAFSILDVYFNERPDVLVGGEGYLCRDTHDRSGWVVPDCVVAFGVDARAILDRNGYVIDEVGKPPDFVLEVGSASTGRADYTTKRDTYAEYGVGEYWRFDPTGGQHHDAALAGERLVDGVYEPLPLHRERGGNIGGYSPVLGLELHWDKGRLRFYDPAVAEYLPDLAEAKITSDSAVRERDSAIYERDSAIYERDSAIHERDAEAEARRKAEAELQRLREQIARPQSE